MDNDTVLARCVAGVVDARAMGLRTDRAIARFLNLRFALGHNFPAGNTAPEIASILQNRTWDENRRLDHVWAKLLGLAGRESPR